MQPVNSYIILLFIFLCCSANKAVQAQKDVILAAGQMPNAVVDKINTIHVVYGNGDSIMYTNSSDQAITFSTPSLIAVLPKAYSSAMRGPQVAAVSTGIIVTACNSFGDIYCFRRENGMKWTQIGKVNDVDTIAKEGLMSLSAEGDNAFAVWLDLRQDDRNKIYGSRSKNGGKTWEKNRLIYSSPDSTVCECCKPSVLINGNVVNVMFRNWLHGNRDLYLVQSSNLGTSFGEAQKLGMVSWKLNGCPMDGGSLAVNKEGKIQTVWRRDSNIYAAVPGLPEVNIGTGRDCTMTVVNDKNVYSWAEKGEIIVFTPQAEKKVLGKGRGPILKSLGNNKAICIWENDKQVHAKVVQL